MTSNILEGSPSPIKHKLALGFNKKLPLVVLVGPYVIVSVTRPVCELLVLDLRSLSYSIFSIGHLSEAHTPYPVRSHVASKLKDTNGYTPYIES